MAKEGRIARINDRQAQRQAEMDAAAALSSAPEQTFVEQVTDTATGAIDTITDTASNVANTVTDTASNVAGTVSDAVTTVGDAATSFRDRAQVIAPGVFGDRRNLDIMNRQQAGQ